MIETFKAQKERDYTITMNDGTIYSFICVSEVKPRGNPGDMTATAFEFVHRGGRTTIRESEMKMCEYWEASE